MGGTQLKCVPEAVMWAPLSFKTNEQAWILVAVLGVFIRFKLGCVWGVVCSGDSTTCSVGLLWHALLCCWLSGLLVPVCVWCSKLHSWTPVAHMPGDVCV